MKKYLIILFSMAFLSLGLSSCETTYAGIDSSHQYGDEVYTSNQEALLDNIDINLIVTYGTPYYYNDYLNYYYYRGLYYYPIFYHNYWYFRPYYHPFRRGYFPSCHNWRPRPHWRGYQGFGRPDRYGRVYRPNANHRNYNYRPNVRPRVDNGNYNVRPNNGSRRFGNGSTNIVPRSSTRTPSTRSRSIGTNRTFGTFSRPSGSSFGRSSGIFSRPSRGSFGGSRNVGGSRPSGGSFGGHR